MNNTVSGTSVEQAKELVALCRAGKLYDVEKWIAAGKSMDISSATKGCPQRTLLEIAVEIGFHSLVELIAQNETSQSALLEILKTWKQTTAFADAEDWIFASAVKLGRMPLGYTSVWNVLTQTCTRLGIAHVSSHCFRHTYRSWLDALGSPIGLQQRMMRHSSITTTANYGDTVASDLRQAHERVVQRALQHGNGTEGSATH
jgi:hypothetical protein